MKQKKVVLFPDTNLFIECLPLEDIDWSIIGECDAIDLVVTLPVQREIDNQKKRPTGRPLRRARKTATLFRDMLINEDGCITIQDKDPEVKLLIEPQHQPDVCLEKQLDFQKPDDALVGTVHTFASQNPDTDVRLLTHDTGPMATAKMVNVVFCAIPDSWLSPPEKSKEEKEADKLRQELTTLKKQEPQFEIECRDIEGKQVKSLEFEYVFFEELSEKQISELMMLIKEQHPIATDFGPKEPTKKVIKPTVMAMYGATEQYTPATDDEIEAYKNQTYPEWLERCEEFLRDLHLKLKRRTQWPEFTFCANNIGTRPGKDVLVTVTAKGDIKIFSPPKDDEDSEDNKLKKKLLRLPSPPAVPRGRKVTHDYDAISLLRQATAMQSIMPSLAAPPPIIGPRKIDPNAFYWKPKKPMAPTSTFQFECQQWRHGSKDENFSGSIYAPLEEGETSGALQCCIEAENISAPIKLTIPVCVKVKKESCFDKAEDLVKWLSLPGLYSE